MTTVHATINEYFASASSVAKKIVHDYDIIRQSYGDDWDGFSLEEREQELWTNLVHPDIEEKYASYAQPENKQEVFPKLKIECGEKIVVDFENEDGWTWRDEHSGPFSWRSKSQQDLALFDDDDAPDTPVTVTRKTNSASSASPLIFTPKQSIWHSPFLRAQSSDITSDTAQVFTRFGINLGSRDEDESSCSESGRIQSNENDLADHYITKDGGYENRAIDVTDSVEQTEPSQTDTSVPLSINIIGFQNGDELGQVSPVFESDTDDMESANQTTVVRPFSDSVEYDREMQSFHDYFSEACAQLDRNEQQQHSAITKQPQSVTQPVSQATSDGDSHTSPGTTSDNLSVTNMSVKSGYDFLDNW